MDARDAVGKEMAEKLKIPDSSIIPAIMKRLIQTEEEAKIVLELSITPEVIASTLGISKEDVGTDIQRYQLEAIAKKLNIPSDKVKEIVQQKFELGILFPTRRGWRLGRNWLQFRESTLGMEPEHYDYVGKEYFDMMRAHHLVEWYPRGAQRSIEAKAAGIPNFQRCLPDWQAIKDNPDRLPFEYLPDILERATKLEGMEKLTFVNCPCKAMEMESYQKSWDKAIESGWSKDSPGSKADIKACLQMGRSADYSLRRGTGVQVTLEEALQQIKEFEDSGGVHLSTGNVKELPNPVGGFWMICNCFLGSCDATDEAKLFGLPEKMHCAPSRYRAFIDTDKCKSCQTCVERCFFGAAQMKQYPMETKWKAWVDPDLCMGCGSCTLTCPAGARTLKVVRPPEWVPDVSNIEAMTSA